MAICRKLADWLFARNRSVRAGDQSAVAEAGGARRGAGGSEPRSGRGPACDPRALELRRRIEAEGVDVNWERARQIVLARLTEIA